MFNKSYAFSNLIKAIVVCHNNDRYISTIIDYSVQSYKQAQGILQLEKETGTNSQGKLLVY